MENREDRIRAKAHELWQAAGRPSNRQANDFRTEAEHLVNAEARERAFRNRPRPGVDITPDRKSVV